MTWIEQAMNSMWMGYLNIIIYIMDIVDICWYFIAGLYNMCVQVYEFIAGGKARR